MKQNQAGRGAREDVILTEVPVGLKKLVDLLAGEDPGLVDPLLDLLQTIRGSRRSFRGGRAVDYAAVEDRVAEKTAALERSVHARLLQELVIDAPEIEIGGRRYRRCARSQGTYYTLAGAVRFERPLYREQGRRDGRCVDPVALRTGAFGRGWLPKTAQAIGFLIQQGTSREAAMAASQMGRLPYSRASFERVGHLLGSRWHEQHAEIEDELITEIEIPEEAYSISVALDRVAVPMEEPLKRPRGRPRKGAPKRPVARNWRMAYCATVTLHDREGQSLLTIRHGCMPEGDVDLLCYLLVTDMCWFLERREDLELVQLADGAPEMWHRLGDLLLEATGREPVQILDFWHLIEKLGAAAKLLPGPETARMHRWETALRRRSKAAREILVELEGSGREWAKRDGERPVHEAITYLKSNHRRRMNYASAIRRGLPIGSGNVEATGKSLVGIRMKRAGSRWKHETGEHVLKLRALALSDLWDEAMPRLHERHRIPVRPAA